MVREAKTTKEISLQNAVKKALKELYLNMEDAYVDVAGCYDASGTTIESDCVETCKSGNFSATVRINIPNGDIRVREKSGLVIIKFNN